MATRTASLAPTNNTDANFRLWINEIHNALIAFGWIQTTDTGQVNFSTVTRPTAVLTYQGYAMYKMGDALQTTTAVFMRIDFGTGNNTDGPSVKIQVCIGATDGAGLFTGIATNNISTLVQVNATGQSQAGGSATLNNCRSSGSTSSFRMSFWSATVSNQGFTFMIERDRDTSGNNTALGVCILSTYPDGNTSSIRPVSQFISNVPGEFWPTEGGWRGFVSAQTSQSGGGNIGLGPVRVAAGPFRPPGLNACVSARTDFTIETTTTMTLYGVSHTYLMLRPDAGSTGRPFNGWNTDCGFGMLWE